MTESQRQAVPRVDTGELDTALAFLGFARDSLVKKCAGLDEEQVRRVLVPTGTNLLGLVRHMIDGERWWFTYHLAGDATVRTGIDFGMGVPPERDAADVIAEYRAVCEDSDAIVRRLGDPDALSAETIDGERKTVRWVLAHVTSETARHAGHADVIRELIDGVTGR